MMTFTYAANPAPGEAIILSRWLIGFGLLVSAVLIMYFFGLRKATKDKRMWRDIIMFYIVGFTMITVLTGIHTHWNLVWKIME